MNKIPHSKDYSNKNSSIAFKLDRAIPPWYSESPTLPFTPLLSEKDSSLLDMRMRSVFASAGAKKGELISFLVSPRHIYAASLVSEIAIYFGYGVELILNGDSAEGYSPVGEMLFVFDEKLRSLTEDTLNRLRAVVSFNNHRLETAQIWRVDVLYIDALAVIAARWQDYFYRPLGSDLTFEKSIESTLLISTVGHECIPLRKYDTRIQIQTLTHKGGFLL